jgi:peptidoglycan LD-endopeptidase CwlK
MINSRAISDLNNATRLRATAFKAACAQAGIDILITSTYRDHEAQRALYAQGRTASGNIVTNAKPGQSWHNWRCAFDFVPIVNGKAQWSDKALFEHCGKIAESVGLEWAGRWKTFKEMAHCQYTVGATLADYQSGEIKFA